MPAGDHAAPPEPNRMTPANRKRAGKPRTATPANSVFTAHDHAACVIDALQMAQQRCETMGAHLTPLRRQVLELVLKVHRPTGAYELLEQLAQATQKRIAPPTVYRALDFLVDMGLVHRIASLNAYLACNIREDHGEAVFFICRECRNALEINSSAIATAISDTAAKARFIAQQRTVEVLGLCSNCAADPTETH